MAARSVKVSVINNSSNPLVDPKGELDHGSWVTWEGDPFFYAQTLDTGYWISESDGVMTGTQGKATYACLYGLDLKYVTFYWDNPWDGENSYSADFPSSLKVTHTSGHGDNAEVTFTVEDA